MDSIAAMMGLEIDDEAKARQLADQLRGEKRAADFFSITTVPSIARGAQTAAADVMDSAQRAGSQRQQGLQRALQQSMQDERFEEDRRVRALQRTHAKQDYTRERRNKRLDDERTQGLKESTAFWTPDGIVRARMKDGITVQEGTNEPMPANAIPLDEYTSMIKNRVAGKGEIEPEYGDPDFEYTRAATKDEREFEQRTLPTQILAGIEAQASYEPEFKPTIPLTGAIENVIGGTAGIPATDTLERQAKWWRNWKFFNELEQRHELFGSALTESEQREWRAATINPNTKPEQIQEFLKIKAEKARKMAEYEVARLAAMGRSRADLLVYGNVVDVDDIIRRARDGSYFDELAERQRADREASGMNLRPGEGDVPGMPGTETPAAATGAPDYENMSLEELRELKAGREAAQRSML